MSTKLAIAIPTYNRAEMLEYNLLQIIDELIQYHIPVYISDDSTNDETEKVFDRLKDKHKLFHYKKNEISLGHDLNCLHTISLPIENYVWYMGDSMIIKKGAIQKILSIMDGGDYDFICCNAEGRDLDINNMVFSNGVELMEMLCWHLTMTGATVYNKSKIFDIANFEVSKFKNFPQIAIIFEQFAANESRLFWTNEKLIYSNSQKNSYWESKVFEVFIDDYRSFLYNLSEVYTMGAKNGALLQHSLKTGIFSCRSFVLYRIGGFYNYEIFKKYKDDFKNFTRTNSLFLLILSFVWIKPLSKFNFFLRRINLNFRN
ncbi:Glycosyltransferase involved in cell wall bisynthesis [Flavobacterium fluvii]|uniref:Glycosyltransferase involved in cell wall bisynthesis n=1 Tax=Flavobacterium fluvii TaxID=468056 RepID=A0A1M5IP95_9FLAO|nr:glycosyltransferase family 2 protein [Flavobacterium fluvii]SHG29770.1 Glycosyltransferase involved in cell wall bisynthesis [Flavobacterium fluvii]